MRTLAQKYPQGHQKLTENGYTSIAQMMTIFHKCSDMDRVFGTNSAVNNWCRAQAMPAYKYELKAGDWLNDRQTADEPKTSSSTVSARDLILDQRPDTATPPLEAYERASEVSSGAIPDIEAMALPASTPSAGTRLLMVSCGEARLLKVQKVLEMMECDVVELD